MIPSVVAVAATICVVATCIFGAHTIVAPTTLAGAYNVPYFSTFLVPDVDTSGTPGGLHQAAASYESLLRNRGVIDDDGAHYLNPSQVQILMTQLYKVPAGQQVVYGSRFLAVCNKTIDRERS